MLKPFTNMTYTQTHYTGMKEYTELFFNQKPLMWFLEAVLYQHLGKSIKDIMRDTKWHLDLIRMAIEEFQHPLLCESVDLCWGSRALLTLREVLTKRHCVLKEVSGVRTRGEGAKTQSGRLWIARLTLLLHRTRMEREYRLDWYLSTRR